MSLVKYGWWEMRRLIKVESSEINLEKMLSFMELLDNTIIGYY